VTETGRGAGGDPRAVLADAVDTLRRRLRNRRPLWWRGPAESGRSRAAVVTALIRDLVDAERAVGPDPAPPGAVPPAPPREDVLADQLAVVAYDLLLALTDGAHDAAAEAVARCVLTAYDVDPRPVPGAQLDAALRVQDVALRGRVERLPRLRDA
jgi:hypothetical protein